MPTAENIENRASDLDPGASGLGAWIPRWLRPSWLAQLPRAAAWEVVDTLLLRPVRRVEASVRAVASSVAGVVRRLAPIAIGAGVGGGVIAAAAWALGVI